MRGFFARIGSSIARFMYGRYGFDELSKCLWIVSLVLLVVSILPFPFFFLLYLVGILLLVYVFFRTFSKKIYKRRRERDWYMKKTERFRRASKLRKHKKRDRKTHVYFKCKSCKNVLRVPKNKGTIIVTCPVCKNKTEKTT